MIPTDFDDLRGRLTGLLIALEPVLNSDEVGYIAELLDHAELGEGLRTLAWLLVEKRKPVGESDVLEIRVLASRMGITPEMPDEFRIARGSDG